MNFLLNNPVANMYGPHFLLLYAVVACLMLGAAAYAAHKLRPPLSPFPPPVPDNPDPYAVAFLRQGEDEVIRLGLVSLIQKGRLEVVGQSKWFGNRLSLVRATHPGSDPLTPLEDAVLSAVGGSGPGDPVDCRSAKLREAVQDFCKQCEKDLEQGSLLTPVDARQAALRQLIPFGVFLAGLAAYKLGVALANGHTNVGWLIVMAFAALIILALLGKPERLTATGKQYLQSLEHRFETSALQASNGPVGAATVLLVVSVLGLSALQSTGYGMVHDFFARENLHTGPTWSNGGGCGGGCGGGGCGGGCGGCG